MNPIIAWVKRSLFGKDWQALRTTNKKHAAIIKRFVDTGARSHPSRISLSFDPARNKYWLAFHDDKWEVYTPVPYPHARAILVNQEEFKTVFPHLDNSKWLDGRSTVHSDFISALTDTGLGHSDYSLRLMRHEESDTYWLEHLTRRGMGEWNDYERRNAGDVDTLVFSASSAERYWPMRGWLNDKLEGDSTSIRNLIPTGDQNIENGISLLCQPDSSVHWLKHTMAAGDDTWHAYQPISFEQAQEIKTDNAIFREYVLHNWVVKGRLNQYIATHKPDIAQLVETGSANPDLKMCLLQHQQTREYWVKRVVSRGSISWFEYRRVSEDTTDDLKQTNSW